MESASGEPRWPAFTRTPYSYPGSLFTVLEARSRRPFGAWPRRVAVRRRRTLIFGRRTSTERLAAAPRPHRVRWLLAPELPAGIARVKSAKVESASGPASGSASGRSAQPCAAPVRGSSAQRWALFGRIHAGGDRRRTARECAGAVGVVPAISDVLWYVGHPPALAVAATDNGRLAPGNDRQHRAREEREKHRRAHGKPAAGRRRCSRTRRTSRTTQGLRASAIIAPCRPAAPCALPWWRRS